MTSRKGREGIRAELPKETKEALKDADKPMWEVIDEAVRMSLGVGDADTEQAFRRRIERLEQKRQNVQSQIESLNKELDSVEQKIEDEQSRLEQYLAERDSIEEVQDEVLDEIAGTSKSVYAKRDKLRELARREYGHETDENIQKVITDLKERRTGRDRAISDAQFTQNVRTKANGTADGGLSLRVLEDTDE
jgi:chromosome segregation ATPase